MHCTVDLPRESCIYYYGNSYDTFDGSYQKILHSKEKILDWQIDRPLKKVKWVVVVILVIYLLTFKVTEVVKNLLVVTSMLLDR